MMRESDQDSSSAGNAPLGPTVVLVEGTDDVQFFSALIQHTRPGSSESDVGSGGYGLQLQAPGGKRKFMHVRVGGIDVVEVGKDEFGAMLNALVSNKALRKVGSIGVVRDADRSASKAFEDVRRALGQAGLAAPKFRMRPAGRSPRVTVMIMPGSAHKGCLEDLCLRSVEAEPLMSCVRDFIACAERSTKSPPRNLSKAKVQAYLAAMEHDNLRLGFATKKGIWPLDRKAFDQVKRFLSAVTL
jgi:hypothetical protein